MSKLLAYDPNTRITAQEALKHPYFQESPLPQDPSLFPTFPSKGAGEKRKTVYSPSAPHAPHGEDMDEDQIRQALNAHSNSTGGFRLRY